MNALDSLSTPAISGHEVLSIRLISSHSPFSTCSVSPELAACTAGSSGGASGSGISCSVSGATAGAGLSARGRGAIFAAPVSSAFILLSSEDKSFESEGVQSRISAISISQRRLPPCIPAADACKRESACIISFISKAAACSVRAFSRVSEQTMGLLSLFTVLIIIRSRKCEVSSDKSRCISTEVLYSLSVSKSAPSASRRFIQSANCKR